MSRYISIAKGSQDNKVYMNVASNLDWTRLSGSPTLTRNQITVDADHKPYVCYTTISSNNFDTNSDVFKGIGLEIVAKDGVSLYTDGSIYDTMMTSSDRYNANNRQFTRLDATTKPDDWDDLYDIKYFTKVQGTRDGLTYEGYIPATSTWSSSTTYYTCEKTPIYWYLGDGNKTVRFGVGDIGAGVNGFPTIGALSLRDYDNHMYYTYIDENRSEHRLVDAQSSASYVQATLSSNAQNSPALCFGPNIASRYLNGETYNSSWKSTVTDEQKGRWRADARNKINWTNVTNIQLGSITKDDVTYYGIWVVIPEIKYYLGYEQYVQGDSGCLRNYTSSNPYSKNQQDYRIYNLNSPISDENSYKVFNVSFYGVQIDALGVTVTEKEGQRPPDTNPDLPDVKGWTALKPILPTKRSLGSLAGSNEPGFHVYDVYQTVYKQFIGNLWNWGNPGANVWEQLNEDGYIKNPIAGITGVALSTLKGAWESVKESKVDPLAAIQTCFALPGYINTQVQSEGDYGNIKIAGLNLGESFKAYCCKSETYVWTVTIDTSGLGVTQSYLDTAPYSTAEVYLPYIGMVQINPADCIGTGGSIDITYSTCVVDGTISATIVCHTGLASANPTQYGPYTSNAAYRIPIAQKDANAFDRSMGYMSAIGTGLGGIFNIVKGSLSTLASNPRNQNAIMNQGMSNIGTYANASASMIGQMANSYLIPQVLRGSQLGTGSAIVCNTREVAVIVSTPLPVYDDWRDSSLAGFMSGKIDVIDTFSDNGKNLVSYSYAKLDKITATAAEIEDIKSILYGGVYQ